MNLENKNSAKRRNKKARQRRNRLARKTVLEALAAQEKVKAEEKKALWSLLPIELIIYITSMRPPLRLVDILSCALVSKHHPFGRAARDFFKRTEKQKMKQKLMGIAKMINPQRMRNPLPRHAVLRGMLPISGFERLAENILRTGRERQTKAGTDAYLQALVMFVGHVMVDGISKMEVKFSNLRLEKLFIYDTPMQIPRDNTRITFANWGIIGGTQLAFHFEQPHLFQSDIWILKQRLSESEQKLSRHIEFFMAQFGVVAMDSSCVISTNSWA